jgi:hypothetical protein
VKRKGLRRLKTIVVEDGVTEAQPDGRVFGFGTGRFEPRNSFSYVIKDSRGRDGLGMGIDNPLRTAEKADFMNGRK